MAHCLVPEEQLPPAYPLSFVKFWGIYIKVINTADCKETLLMVSLQGLENAKSNEHGSPNEMVELGKDFWMFTCF